MDTSVTLCEDNKRSLTYQCDTITLNMKTRGQKSLLKSQNVIWFDVMLLSCPIFHFF